MSGRSVESGRSRELLQSDNIVIHICIDCRLNFIYLHMCVYIYSPVFPCIQLFYSEYVLLGLQGAAVLD